MRSVDSDTCGLLTRQESQGSLSGKSVDLDVPSAISEDVFYGDCQEHQDRLGISSIVQELDQQNYQSSTSKGSLSGKVKLDVPSTVTEDTLSALGQMSKDSPNTNTEELEELNYQSSLCNKIDNSERRTGVSHANSEVNTPDSIVVLTSDSSSPDAAEVSTSSSMAERTRLSVHIVPGKVTSPISSPDSIEVLGSSSLVTSPSSIEVNGYLLPMLYAGFVGGWGSPKIYLTAVFLKYPFGPNSPGSPLHIYYQTTPCHKHFFGCTEHIDMAILTLSEGL